MKIYRKQEMAEPEFDLKDLQVGDQIEIKLDGFGDHTATVQRIHNKKAYVLFDDCVLKGPMNDPATNEGGFEKSELNKLMQEELLPAFPEDIRKRIKTLTIPTFGQIFGHKTGYCVEEDIIADKDKQFELMKIRKNRIADFENEWAWYWLRNAIKKKVSATGYAACYAGGNANAGNASLSCGVRPLLIIDI